MQCGMNVKAIRRANLVALLEQHDRDVDFAELCGLAPGHLSQMKTSKREVGDEVAARIEQRLRLEPGWMDRDHSRRAAEDRTPYLASQRVPVVGTAQLGDDGYWLELEYPTGSGDGFVDYPSRDPNAYALRCKGDSMRPRIKPGEFVVAEPNQRYNPGDEVVVKDRRGRVMVKVFNFTRDGMIELGSINEDHRPITLDAQEIEYVHRVVAILQPLKYYRDIA